MSERDRYPAAVPCWVETLQPDPRAALDFYGPLFGWEFAGPGPMPGDPPGQYFVARVKGRDVAGIGSRPSNTQAPEWTTYIRVDSVDETVATATKAGGSLRHGPFDVLPAGRLAVLADPAGARFGVWQAGAREGAQLVNEPQTWAMNVLHTTDPEPSNAFYGAVFGWQPQPFGPPEGRSAVLRLPDYVGGEPRQPVPRDVVAVVTRIPDGASSTDAQPHWRVHFCVADADASAAHAIRLGGAVIVPPHDTPGLRNCVLADPHGAVFSVSQVAGSP